MPELFQYHDKIERLNQKILHINIVGISRFKLWKLLMQENKIVVRKYWKETKEVKLGYHIDNEYPKKSFAKHIRRNLNKVEGRVILNLKSQIKQRYIF